MTTIERLYGVAHRLEVSGGGLWVKEVPITPSSELFQELSALPKGTKVGVEFFPEENFPVNEFPIELSSGSKFYWHEIIAACYSYGLVVAFLDDLSTFKRFVSKLLEADSLQGHLNVFLEEKESGQLGFPGCGEERVKAFKAAIYRARVEARYIYEIEREERMVENILQNQPQIVIIGGVHADFLMRGEESLSQRGMTVKAYLREDIPEEVTGNLSWPFLSTLQAQLSKNSLPDPEVFLARERLIRQYNAVTLGRVTLGNSPDFIGTWDPELEPRGLFEVYPNKGEGPEFSGIIEDTLGTASFRGRRDEDEIGFIKTYNPKYFPAGEPVSYQGIFRQDQYEGEWRTGDNTGRFILKRWNPGAMP